jgi:hypothetical protein
MPLLIQSKRRWMVQKGSFCTGSGRAVGVRSPSRRELLVSPNPTVLAISNVSVLARSAAGLPSASAFARGVAGAAERPGNRPSPSSARGRVHRAPARCRPAANENVVSRAIVATPG